MLVDHWPQLFLGKSRHQCWWYLFFKSELVKLGFVSTGTIDLFTGVDHFVRFLFVQFQDLNSRSHA